MKGVCRLINRVHLQAHLAHRSVHFTLGMGMAGAYPVKVCNYLLSERSSDSVIGAVFTVFSRDEAFQESAEVQ